MIEDIHIVALLIVRMSLQAAKEPTMSICPSEQILFRAGRKSMNIVILKGNIVSAPSFGNLEIYENGYIAAEDGIIKYVGSDLPKKYKNCEITDYKDQLIMQSFADMHLHAPQYPNLGIGLELNLLDWLNTYTFPTEAYFKDTGFAREVYRKLAEDLVQNGTTRVSVFSSLHTDSTLILMDELEKAGLRGFVGKVNMDRNGGKDLEETTEESIRETLRWLDSCTTENIKPIITPRFTPSCSNELLKELSKIARERDLPIQSHLSENISEQEWVKSLHPDTTHYYESYKKYGLWNEKTLMAHCVYSDKEERKAMKDAGVYVVHCPSSNINLSSGFAPIREMIDEGLNVVLGSDIAGGSIISMFANTAEAIKCSKERSIRIEGKPKMLSVSEAFYLATSASSTLFNETPGFSKGNSLDAIVLDDQNLINAKHLSVRERFERAIYRREENAIKAVYSKGRKLF